MPAALSSAAFVAASLASLAAFAAQSVDFLSASLAASCCNALGMLSLSRFHGVLRHSGRFGGHRHARLRGTV